MQTPELLASVSRMIVERQNNVGNKRPDQGHGHHIAVLPLSRTLPLRRLTHSIKFEMRQFARTLAMDSHQFDILYGKSGASQTAFSGIFNSSITAWLDDRENRYGHVLYIADYDWTPWTKRCLNRADRLLFLVDASEGHELRDIERKIKSLFATRKHKPRIEYAFIHPSETIAPKRTARWLKIRPLSAYHHIRLDDQNHYARLARRLTSNANGLILSAGGARGYVHLGVHRAIEEMQIPIDYVGGASMGALLGGAMAMGLSSSQIIELSDKFANPKSLFDYTLPIVALMTSAKLTAFCRELYQDTHIEDLWTPYFCISSDLAYGTEVCHRSGLLWQAVRSSVAIPGVFTPVPTQNGKLLVDGAVLNTFPVEKLQQLMYGGNLIGVNVSQNEVKQQYYNYGMSLSGWTLLKDRLNPFATTRIRSPRIIETLLRANDIRSIEDLKRRGKQLDVLIEPQVSEYSLLDFKSYAKISEVGYLAAINELSASRKLYCVAKHKNDV